MHQSHRNHDASNYHYSKLIAKIASFIRLSFKSIEKRSPGNSKCISHHYCPYCSKDSLGLNNSIVLNNPVPRLPGRVASGICIMLCKHYSLQVFLRNILHHTGEHVVNLLVVHPSLKGHLGVCIGTQGAPVDLGYSKHDPLYKFTGHLTLTLCFCHMWG